MIQILRGADLSVFRMLLPKEVEKELKHFGELVKERPEDQLDELLRKEQQAYGRNF